MARRQIDAGAVPTLLRRMNERRVMEVLMRRGPASRADLTRYTGISAPTISKAVASLSDAGFIEEQDLYLNKTGRPGHLYRLAAQGVQILGVAIDPQYCWVVCTGMDCKVAEERVRRFDTPDNYEALLDQIVFHAKRLMDMTPDARMLGLGITVPGHVDRTRWVAIDCANIDWLEGQPIVEDLKRQLDLETAVLVKQSQAMCLAERWSDAARPFEFFAYVDLTYDVTVGVIKGSQLMRGQHGVSGALGQLPVPDPEFRNGSTPRLKQLATDLAFSRAVAKRTGKKMRSDQIIEAMLKGQLKIDDIVDRTLEFMAVGVAAVINIFDPEAVFVHSRILDAGDELFDRLVARSRGELTHAKSDCQVLRGTAMLPCAPTAAFVYNLTETLGPRFD